MGKAFTEEEKIKIKKSIMETAYFRTDKKSGNSSREFL